MPSCPKGESPCIREVQPCNERGNRTFVGRLLQQPVSARTPVWQPGPAKILGKAVGQEQPNNLLGRVETSGYISSSSSQPSLQAVEEGAGRQSQLPGERWSPGMGESRPLLMKVTMVMTLRGLSLS